MILKLYIFFYYRDLNFAVGPTLYSGWYYRGLNVAVGPTLGQRLKVYLGRCTNVSPTEIKNVMTFQNCLNVHVLVISKFFLSSNVAVGPTFESLKNSGALRQRFTNRNKKIYTFKKCLNIIFWINISNFFLHFVLSSWSECRRWPNIGPTLESFCKSDALRQRVTNRNKTSEHPLH